MAWISNEYIRSDQPPNFEHAETIFLELMYQTRPNGDYIFRYKKYTTEPKTESFVDNTMNNIRWSGPIPLTNLHEVLHIYIWADTIVDIRTIESDANHPFSWSFHDGRQAVMTVDNLRTLYGELLYEKTPGVWVPASQMSATDKCMHIRYKAKYNKPSQKKGHKFSYYVRMKDQATNSIKNYEIDPDIRNPPVDDP